MSRNKTKNSARNQRRKLRKKQMLENQAIQRISENKSFQGSLDDDLLSMENLYKESKIDPDTYVGQVRVDIPQMEKAIKDSKELNKMNENKGWKSWLVSWVW